MTVPDNGVRTGRELPLFAESATAPRLMPLGFIGYPHVAGIAALAVNVGLCKLQPLARLCEWCQEDNLFLVVLRYTPTNQGGILYITI